MSAGARSAYYILTQDLDFTGVEGPVLGNSSNYFSGNFNGNGKTISNLTISRSEGTVVGLFGSANGATIQNLIVSLGAGGVSSGGYGYVGGLVGYLVGGTVTQCAVIGTGSVSGGSYTGGLVGQLTGSSVFRSYSTVAVSGTNSVGGLVGEISGGSTIQQSYTHGSVTGTTSSLGGLVGNSTGTVQESYSTGAILGGSSLLGGLTGVGAATRSLWDTQTSGKATSAGGSGRSTALLQDQQTFVASGWDFANAWRLPDGGGYPVLQYFTPLAVPVTVDSLFAGGSGTIGDPYQISTPAQLQNLNLAFYVSAGARSAYYILTQDLDFTGAEGPVLGDTTIYFSGNFNGNGKTISNLTISRSEAIVGLFGFARYATIQNLIVSLGAGGVSSGGSGYVGGLAGYLVDSTVSQCAVIGTGSVSGGSTTGGLVGDLSNTDVSRSYATVAVSGTGYVGGLVGLNESGSTVLQSFARGSVTATSFAVGGLVGYNDGAVTESYAMGAIIGGTTNVGGLTGIGAAGRSFWDTQTSGKATSAGGTAATTADMTLTDGNIDSLLDLFMGTAPAWDTAVWNLPPGDYPTLK